MCVCVCGGSEKLFPPAAVLKNRSAAPVYTALVYMCVCVRTACGLSDCIYLYTRRDAQRWRGRAVRAGLKCYLLLLRFNDNCREENGARRNESAGRSSRHGRGRGFMRRASA